MSEWLNIIPLPLLLMTVILVLFPTLFCIAMRAKLYAHQKDIITKVRRLLRGESSGIKPKILTTLEERFKTASFNLEQVNTDALIDGAYIQEKFNCFGFSLNCEKWDYFCRVLPNLLLAFGLLGTFIGITLNLYDLSQTINQNQFDDVNELIAQVQKPLKGMGIAFFTSLIGILCSAILTIFNIRWNTNVYRNLLLSSLADYLDNVLHPSLEGHSRLDRAVNSMVEKQNEFLTRFHEKVGQVLENTIGKETQKMTDANAQAQQLVIKICERLMEVSGTLSQGANTFQNSVGLVNQEVVALSEVLPKVREYAQVIGQSAVVFQSASQQIEQSKFSENLERTITELATTQKHFAHLTLLLKDNVEKLVTGNLESNQLAQKVYTQLENYSSLLKESSTELVKVSQVFRESEFANQLTQATRKLEEIEGLFEVAVLQLNQGTKPLDNLAISLQNSINSLSLNESEFANQLTQATKKIEEIEGSFEVAVHQLNQGTKPLESSVISLQETIQKISSTGEDFKNLSNKITNLVALADNRLNHETVGQKQLNDKMKSVLESIEHIEYTLSDQLQKIEEKLSQSTNLNDQIESIKKYFNNEKKNLF